MEHKVQSYLKETKAELIFEISRVNLLFQSAKFSSNQTQTICYKSQFMTFQLINYLSIAPESAYDLTSGLAWRSRVGSSLVNGLESRPSRNDQTRQIEVTVLAVILRKVVILLDNIYLSRSVAYINNG